MKNRRGIMVVICLAIVFMAAAAFAVPQTINYQGKLEGSGGPVNGTVSMTFAIYNAPSGGSALWTETQSSVAVIDGAFSVALGSLTPITLPFDEQYYLGVNVSGDGEMSPRAVLVSVPYAMRADDADTLNGQHSSEIIDAASDEVRTPISSLPFIISTSGSYYLTGDLSMVSTTANGITVNANDVTIDLMGFSIKGPGYSSGTGIYMNGMNVEVKNGTVKGFGRGVDTGPSNARIINIRAFENENEGIRTYIGLVKDCTAALNGSSGIYVQGSSIVSGNFAYQNEHDGIKLAGESFVDGNTAFYNDQTALGYDNISSCISCTFGTNHAP